MAILTEGRIVPLISLLLVWVATYVSINMGKEGKIKIKRIAGLDAIEEVIGRAVETCSHIVSETRS